MELYHITDRRNVPSIMEKGLQPRIGRRSKRIEPDPVICLTERKYVPYWLIMLGLRSPTVLAANIPDAQTEERKYSDYTEMVVSNTIPPENIRPALLRLSAEEKKNAMRVLCESYIYDISTICTDFAREYTEDVRSYKSKTELVNTATILLRILKNLDYSVYTTEELRHLLKDIGENGIFTFLDTYLNTDKKLYQLSMYHDPYTYDIRTALENEIAHKFHDCLDMSTGGWIGVQ